MPAQSSSSDISPQLYERVIQTAQSILAERDIDRLCERILWEAQRIARADAGTLYLCRKTSTQTLLDFAIVHNDSLNMTLGGSSGQPITFDAIPLYDEEGNENHHNVATRAALTGELIQIADAYQAEGFDFSGTRMFDEQTGYRTRSVLAIPLLNDRNEVVGVLQLLNSLDDSGQPVAFDSALIPVIEMLASFAAIALDQQMLAQEQKELLIELSGEPNTAMLLERILKEAQLLTHADGGTLYLLKEREGSEVLEFALLRNESLGFNQGGASGNPVNLAPLSLNTPDGEPNYSNVATYSALTRQLVNIKDAYQEEQFDFSGTRAFDQKTGYRSQSFLTVPLLNHQDDVIGVLQLVNARDPKTGEIISFSPRIEPIVRALSAYAAIALNNQILVQELKDLLDAFIQCIAKAIDAKSSHTSAHCQRVPLLMELLADAACRDQSLFPDFDLDHDAWYELRVAAWLHDCGKLATPDSVLDKATKLHGMRDGIEAVKARFAALKASREKACLEAMIANPDARESLQADLLEECRLIDEDYRFLLQANKGGEFMSEEARKRVHEIASRQWVDPEGNLQPLLTDEEVYNLCIQRGTLTDEERQVINNHMQVTIDMLESLPFPRKLRRVPEYAGGHHERMDGSGFPRGLTREQMSLPARMMAIADIFEALTARERPYKEPMKISQALSILKSMRDNQHIDPDLYRLFVEKRVWESYAKQALAPEQLDIEDVQAYL